VDPDQDPGIFNGIFMRIRLLDINVCVKHINSESSGNSRRTVANEGCNLTGYLKTDMYATMQPWRRFALFEIFIFNFGVLFSEAD